MPRKIKSRPWATYDNLYELYITKELSYNAIAKKYETFPNTVRRCALRVGVPPRSKEEAQKNYLDKNDHPMLGRERSQIEKRHISDGIQKHWDGLDEDEAQEKREQMSDRARLKWDWMTETEKKKSIKKMHRANREKAGKGSKNENMVAQLLAERGFAIVQRTTDYSPGHVFEIDIAIPSDSLAIEWDGAAHYEPIYGDEALKKTMAKDKRKNAVFIQQGWIVFRCRDHSTAHSMAFCQRAVEAIIKTLKSAKKGRVYHIDVL